MTLTDYTACIEACNQCALACEHCAASCLLEEQTHMQRCIVLDRDCADFCRLAAALMARGSDFAAAVCEQCAAVCEACGEECAKHAPAHCQNCARACRACAQECRNMAEQAMGLASPASTSARHTARH